MVLQPACNLILASLLTGVYDVNRNENIPSDNFDTIKDWYNSIICLKLNAIVFHNNLSVETVSKYQNEYVQFIQHDLDKSYNANIYRYIIYHNFLTQYKAFISNVFVTDITDVELINNPFIQPLFMQNTDGLFCGDENKMLDNEWMKEHSTHFRDKVPGFKEYEEEFKNNTLLNCGIIGGSIKVMHRLMEQLSLLHKTYSTTNTTAYTLDMGAFNFITRTQFKYIVHGEPVNTIFKMYERERVDCWLRHK